MSGDPILARRDKRTLPKGGELGLPNSCQLGNLKGHGECGRESVRVIGGYRLCAHHEELLGDIVRDANRDASSGRTPNCLPFVLTAGVAS